VIPLIFLILPPRHSLAFRLKMRDRFGIELRFSEADFADKGIGILVEDVNFRCAAQAQVVVANQNQQLLG
jgi:hypothetical protein